MTQLKLNMKTEIDGKTATLTKFCEEPNTGLCVVTYNDWTFSIPNVFAKILFAKQPDKKSSRPSR